MKALLALLAALFRRAPVSEPTAGSGPVGKAEGPLPVVADRFDACLAEILKHEGGYVDHPADPGGATNKGITLATLSDWRGKPVSKTDVMALTTEEAGVIYRARYWNAVKGDQLPAGVDLAVFDYAVNSGPGRAAKDLQAVLGVVQDGIIGPQTISAVDRAPPKTTIIALCDMRRSFLRSLSSYGTFGKGWERRVDEVEAAALKVA